MVHLKETVFWDSFWARLMIEELTQAQVSIAFRSWGLTVVLGQLALVTLAVFVFKVVHHQVRRVIMDDIKYWFPVYQRT